jgi:hypothetical protein
MNSEGRSAYIVGLIVGFLTGASLALALALTFGNAWPNWN